MSIFCQFGGLESVAICEAGFTRDVKTAALATGPKRDSSVRSGQICAGVFHELATEKVDASIQRPLAGGFKLLKRSKDESPVHSMDPETKTIMPSKVLNARMHFRQGFFEKGQ